jgi:hypothetical protein
MFDEETERAIDEYVEEASEARREHDLVFWEGCAVVTVPAGAPPEYITVMVDGVNDPNVQWRGVPGGLIIGDEVLVFENPISHRREIVGSSGATGASTPFVHDHSSTLQGGDDLNPETLTPQTFIVGPTPAPYDTLGEAVVAVNAFGPAAATPCTIEIKGIVTAEAGNITLPNYCHINGEGIHDEQSTIGLGAFQLNMSTNTSISNVCVTSTAGNAIVWPNLSTGYMHNVHILAAGTTAFVTDGTVAVRCHRVLIRDNGVLAAGFRINNGAGYVMLDFCEVDSGGLITDGLDVDANYVITRFCRFSCPAQNDVNVAAGATWYYMAPQCDPTRIIMAGTHVALPTMRFHQTVIVAEEGGDFQAVSEAITWINALGDAAAAKRYGILVLAGNFAEAAGITIPQWVTVAGMGEGSRIEMGANTLTMSDDSSLQDIVVTHSGGTAIDCANADCTLFNVKIIVSNAPAYGVDITGDSAAELYHVIVEFTVSGVTTGFNVSNTATPTLWDCQADDTTNIQTALNLVNAGCTCTTRYCVFHGANDDVATGAASTWIYHQDDFDPDNCTVAGTADPADGQEVVYFPCTKTAGAAGDFATVQAAIDWFKNRLLCALCKIDIVTGASYAETLVIEDVFATAEGRLELEGDVRGMAGATWVDDAVITCQDANAGSGLVNAGAVITVTGAGGNPDFDADGWVNGDTVITRDNAGAIATYTISATLNNTITLTVAAPALGNTGTSITLVPNTVIAPAGAGNAVTVYAQGILLDGLHLDATAGVTGHALLCHGPGAQCECENVLAEADDDGFLAQWGAYIEADDGACTAVECNNVGFWALNGGQLLADYGVAVGCGAAGFYGGYMGFVEADYAVATDCVVGFAGQWIGGINCKYAYALQNTSYGFRASRQGFNRCNDSRTLGTNGIDYRSDYNSYMYAANTNVGGPTYSPAVTDTEGNVFGIITFS